MRLPFPPGMNLRTLNDIFFAVVERRSPGIMLRRHAIDWVPISSQEFSQWVMGVAQALQQWGIGKGDRVAILSENRPEWAVADFACLLLGAVVVPLYGTLTSEQSTELLRDAGVRAIFVSTEKQLQKVINLQPQTSLEKVVVMDAVETTRATAMRRLMQAGPAQPDLSIESLARAIQPADLATIIYTSGTTGRPKGAMLTHGNMASNVASAIGQFGMRAGDVSISFLPLSHVTARHVDYGMLYAGVTLAYVSSIEGLPRALLEVRPTVFVGVPRVYEKIYSQVVAKAAGFPRAQIYRWAMGTGRKHRAEILAGKKPGSPTWKLANRLLFSRVMEGLGGRAHTFISGGAPLARELAEWYADIGIRIHEGYGLTETSPVIAVNTAEAHRLGTVGRPIPGVQARIADDGEILVRGPSIFQGYWNLPQETAQAFVDGWFKTGDIGNLDADGFLSVTDRKKDLIKTSGGKFIAPQPIENSLKLNALIAEAVVLGDRHKFPAVLIAPYFPLLEDWARTNGIAFTSRDELVAQPRVQALYEGIVEDLNHKLARYEKLKKVLLVPDEFSTESGTLTASMKMRRRAVEERYRHLIDQMYVEAEAVGATPRQE